MEEREKDMVALAVGRVILQHVGTLDWDAIAEKIRCDAEKCLINVAEALDKNEINDFECVEEIMTLLEKVGLDTWRHDFG